MAGWTTPLPVPSLLLPFLLAVSLVTFAFYGYDKHQAQRGGGRIPEIVLHLLALLGGSPGALLGQITFRHKTRKRSFRIVFFLILAIQLAALYLYWRHRSNA